MHRRSDVDLLVLSRGPRSALTAPTEVDIRVYPVDGAEDRILAGQEVLAWAVKFGCPLHDPKGIWDAIQRRTADRLPLPSAESARNRAQKALAKAREMLVAGDETAAADLILASATQFVRERLILNGIFPASRPELPKQLRGVSANDPHVQLLEDAMYADIAPLKMLRRLEAASGPVNNGPQKCNGSGPTDDQIIN